jgi:hypothetical protein
MITHNKVKMNELTAHFAYYYIEDQREWGGFKARVAQIDESLLRKVVGEKWVKHSAVLLNGRLGTATELDGGRSILITFQDTPRLSKFKKIMMKLFGRTSI